MNKITPKFLRALADLVEEQPGWTDSLVEMIAKHSPNHCGIRRMLTADDWSEMNKLWKQQGKLQTVRYLRERAGCGLLEAKRFVESHFSR